MTIQNAYGGQPLTIIVFYPGNSTITFNQYTPIAYLIIGGGGNGGQSNNGGGGGGGGGIIYNGGQTAYQGQYTITVGTSGQASSFTGQGMPPNSAPGGSNGSSSTGGSGGASVNNGYQTYAGGAGGNSGSAGTTGPNSYVVVGPGTSNGVVLCSGGSGGTSGSAGSTGQNGSTLSNTIAGGTSNIYPANLSTIGCGGGGSSGNGNGLPGGNGMVVVSIIGWG